MRFESEEEALRAAREADIVLRIYRCDRGAHFHLTSRTKGKAPIRPVKRSLDR